jgi:Ca2+-binding RTX toxin-like protein
MKRSLAPVALLAALAPAAPAGAATVSSDGATVTIAAPARERNAITVTRRSAGGVFVRDRRSPLTAGPGCTQTAPDRAACGSAQTAELVADLGPLGDSVALGASVAVGATLRGGSGNDTLRGGPRGDVLAGGTGRDTVTYSGRTGDVTVTLAGGADDGQAGEGDDVVEVERAVGGDGFDTLIGTEGGNGLYGGSGDDRLDGLGGVDNLHGGRGNDLLQGGAGEDTFVAERSPDGSDALQGGEGADRADYSRRDPAFNLVVDPDGFPDDGDRPGETLTFTGPMFTFVLLGSPERDNVLPDVESVRGGAGADILRPADAGGTVEGGPGTDILYGGPGADSLAGDAGFDRIVARDGRDDAVRCGTEGDKVWGDLADRVDFDCEQRSTTLAPRVAPLARRLEGRALRVRVECPADAFVRCTGTVRAETVRRADGPRRARLGAATFTLDPGASQVVVVPVDADGRALVRRLAPLRVRLILRARDAAGAARPDAARLVLRG